MPPVSLTAWGVVTAFGPGEEALWQGLLSGRSMVREAGLSSAQNGTFSPPWPVARVPEPRPENRSSDRTDALLFEAAEQITETPSWRRVSPSRLGVAVGTTQGSIHSWSRHQDLLQADVHHRPPGPSIAGPVLRLARHLRARGPVACPSMACASGTAAIGLALGWIRGGACDAVVAGGVDALSAFVYGGFAGLKALDPVGPRPFDRDRAGLGLGEGAGLVLLEREVNEGVRVTGWGVSADANHLTGPDPTGSGVARAIRAALRDGGTTTSQVDFVNAHGTGTVFNDRMEGEGLVKVFGARTKEIPVNSIKGAIGHTMGAAGAVEAILCSSVLRRGQVPPTAGLRHLDPEIPLDVVRDEPRPGRFGCAVSTSSGFGGINVSLVFQRG